MGCKTFAPYKEIVLIRIYLDCELTHLPAYPHANLSGKEPGLVSIGCASENDKTFYAENADVVLERCNDRVIENVLTLLDGGDARMPYATIAEKLKAWIEAFGEETVKVFTTPLSAEAQRGSEKVQMLTDAPYVDWPPLAAMFNQCGWPSNLIKEPQWLWIDDGVIDNMFVSDKSSRRHHALDDAVMNKLAHEIELNGTKR